MEEYKKNIKNLEKAHSNMRDAFMEYAEDKSIPEAEIGIILNLFEKAVEDKKCNYYLDSKISKINTKLDEIVNSTTTDSETKKGKKKFSIKNIMHYLKYE